MPSPAHLRAADFEKFFADRTERLLKLDRGRDGNATYPSDLA
jgi:hypothetical protein